MLLWVWVGLLALFIVIEACTAQLVTIWFAVGAFFALITGLASDSILAQVTVFVAVSLVVLIFTRPIVKKTIESKKQPTNADMFIGETGVVTEEVNNLLAKGQCKVKGSVWSAKGETDSVIPEGTQIVVIKIEGVKLIVRPAD
ncbi:MAG: NfeD family protein [Acutalibacteraceae bacterium]